MKIAIFDLGTRATRCLISDTQQLRDHGFNFNNFINSGELTELGKALQPLGHNKYQIQIKGLEKTIRFILRNLNECRRQGVENWNIFAVGTEVFRLAENHTQVCQVIKAHTGIDLTILDPVEEAETSFIAATHSMPTIVQEQKPYLVIEQGGGSMQLTVAQMADGKLNKTGQISIPELGTLLLKQRFVDYASDASVASLMRVGTMYKEVYSYARKTVQDTLTTHFPKNNQTPLPLSAAALGRVITKVFPNKSNKQVHNRTVSIDKMNRNQTNSNIIERYSNYAVRSLLKDAENAMIPETMEDIERTLEFSYGLPSYAAVLDYFNLDKLKVCGTGLRYGVFFRIAFDKWKNIRTF